MSDAIKEFVDKEEKDAISELAKHQIQKTQVTHLVNHPVWPHWPENPLGRPMARQISPRRSPSLFPLFYSNTL